MEVRLTSDTGNLQATATVELAENPNSGGEVVKSDSTRYIQVKDQNLKTVAILKNAYKIGYELEVNNLWTCWFTLPLDDPKNELILPKSFLELWDHNKRIGMFIVNPKNTVKSDSDRSITYECEHVLGTLHSDVIFGYQQFSNFTTREVLEGLLALQEKKHWVLGRCAFERYFHYAFENVDTLLGPVTDVPKPFDQPYLWTWDDSVYPFILNLDEPYQEKVDTIRYGKNMKGIEKEEDPRNICNRIYPLGYGEGVNQLTIESVNNGVPYLEDAQSIAKHGLHKRIWIDRRFEVPENLKASGQGLLDKYSEPLTTVAVDCIDYEHIDPYKLVEYWPGKIVGVYDQDTKTNIDLRTMKLTKNDIYGNPEDIQFELGNVRDDLNSTITDLEKKQLVNETYSQGSTNLDSHDYSDNCDPSNPAVIRFYLPDDLVNVNTLTLTYETEAFRSYSRATKGGGATVKSTSSGGATTRSTSSGGGSQQTSSSGGGTSTSTQSGGGSSPTSTSAAAHRHRMFALDTAGYGSGNTPNLYGAYADAGGNNYGIAEFWSNMSNIYTHSADGSHSHTVTIPSHTHSFTVPNHTHSVTIPDHNHSVTIPDHTHDITLPDHTHDIEHGIFRLSETPTSVTVRVDGTLVPGNKTSAENIDLIPYLSKDNSGKVERGKWHEVTITPNRLGRVNANIISRLFIQSRLGGSF